MVCCMVLCICSGGVGVGVFFFFKQKTAYEMRISDWSSDVCSSDLSVLLKPRSLSSSRNVRLARVSPILCSSTNSSTSIAPLRRKNSPSGPATAAPAAASPGGEAGSRERAGSPSQRSAEDSGGKRCVHEGVTRWEREDLKKNQ